MPLPTYRPNRGCPNHHAVRRGWCHHYGSYQTPAHGRVQRSRCNACGSPMREIAGRYRFSPTAPANEVIRFGRQSMAAQLHLLAHLNPRSNVVFDGFCSCVKSEGLPL